MAQSPWTTNNMATLNSRDIQGSHLFVGPAQRLLKVTPAAANGYAMEMWLPEKHTVQIILSSQ